MTLTGAIRGAEPWHDDLAPAGQLAVQVAFRLTSSGIGLPGEDTCVGTQVIYMPMAGRGAVYVSVQARR